MNEEYMKIAKVQKIVSSTLRILTAVFLFNTMLWCLGTVRVKAENGSSKVVKVGYYHADKFQEYDEDTDTYSGYGYEFLRAIQQYTDWTYEFVPCTFSEGLAMLKDGRIDIMNNVSKTAEREDIYDFSALYTGENKAYLVMRPGDNRVGFCDFDAMRSIKIGLANDSIYSKQLVNLFNKKGIKADISWFSTHEELESAFNNNKIDACIGTKSALKDEHKILALSPESYYMATKKGNSELMDEVNSAISTLRTINPYFEMNLSEKYYDQVTEEYTILTQSEKQYISEHPVAKVMYRTDWYPISYQNKAGEFAGPVRKIYDLIEQRTGLKFEFVPDDGTKDFDKLVVSSHAQMLAEQPADFNYADKYNAKQTNVFISPPLTEVSNRILVQGDTIALIKGDYLSDVCQKIYGNKYKYVYYKSLKECLNKVKDGTADGTLLISYEAEYYRQQRQYSSLTYNIVEEGSYGLAIGVFNDTDERLYTIVQKGLNSIDKGEIINIFNQTVIDLRHDDIITIIMNNPTAAFVVFSVFLTLVVGSVFGHFFLRRLRIQNDIIHEKNIALENANQSTTDFFSRMSHDMRTPMNGILGMAKLSENETNIDILKENLAKIGDSGEYLLGLINDTLDYQRIKSGKMQINKEIVNLREVVTNVIDMVRTTTEKKNITLTILSHNVELDCYVMADPIRIKQILLNLLSNAVKFTPQGGMITVELEKLESSSNELHFKCYVKDSGIGISEDFIKNRMFNTFSQEQNEVTGQYAGSGLGLSIVKNLVELMNGSIQVESELGEGSTFIVEMTFERISSEQARKSMQEQNNSTKDENYNLSGIKVLMAEDHPLNAEIARRLLEKAGCNITWAENGKECLDIFEESKPGTFDIILMDIRMPVMGGLEAAKKIRSLDREDAKSVPIVAMTANAYEEDIRKSIASGMNGHIAKPIDPRTLYSSMKNCLK